LWGKEFEAKGKKITLVLRKCWRTIKNTIRGSSNKNENYRGWEIKKEDYIRENRSERK
jgi:hypothetical protein